MIDFKIWRIERCTMCHKDKDIGKLFEINGRMAIQEGKLIFVGKALCDRCNKSKKKRDEYFEIINNDVNKIKVKRLGNE